MQQQDRQVAFDLSTSRRIHIVGVGGSGMSAIAGVLVSMGHDVSGSDAAPSAALDRVVAAGVKAWVGHDAAMLTPDIEAVAVSSAIGADNPEVEAAGAMGVPVLRRADVLAAIAETRRTVAVAGTHGKTTTSTLQALVLEAGGVRPSWIIGGEILGRGNGAHWDAGAWLVVEADESDGTFVELGAEAVIVTNVEPDHLEHYGGWEGLREAFDAFVRNAGGPRVLCVDDPGAAALAERFDGVTTYGTDAAADYRIVDLELGRDRSRFAIRHGGEVVGVDLPAPGLHNVRNAAAALTMGDLLGVPLATGAAGIASYGGVGRRFEHRGVHNGVTFVDDYAHLPSEVKAAIAAARDGGWHRIVAAFQPHRYSRTEQVGRDFTGAFDGVDLLFLTDVYSAGEPVRPGVDGTIVRDAIEAGPGHPPVEYVPRRDGLAAELAAALRPGDLCLTLGAGDITALADEIKALP